MKKFALFSIFLFTVMGMETVGAAPVVYDESINGDLLDSTPFHSSLFFTLGVGSNTFTGSAGHSGITDFDYLGVTIDTNHTLTDITLSISNITDNSTLRLFGIRFDDPDTIPGDASETFNRTSDLESLTFTRDDTESLLVPFSTFVFESVVPLTEGGYYFGMTSFSGTPLDASIDYTWTFDVTSVPLPSAVWLLGAGIIGLAMARKKKA